MPLCPTIHIHTYIHESLPFHIRSMRWSHVRQFSFAIWFIKFCSLYLDQLAQCDLMGAQTFVLHCFSHFFPSDIFPFHFVWRFLSSLNFSLPTNHFSATLYYAMLCRVWLFRMAHRSAPLRTPCDSVSFRFVIKTQLLFLNTDNVNCDSFFSLHL